MSLAPALVLVGGFLGAGKTSLILAASRVLVSQGKRAAVILNDQGDELVDTKLAGRHGVLAGQVTGGCFCCRFSDLVDAAERLRAFDPDVIFAEAVGSCTDITATTVRPLLRDYGQSFRVAPFTVVVDPRARHEDPELRFLFEQQIAEADLVVESKSDLGQSGDGRRSLSSLTGEGVAEWLDEVRSAGFLRALIRFMSITSGVRVPRRRLRGSTAGLPHGAGLPYRLPCCPAHCWTASTRHSPRQVSGLSI